MMNKDRYDAIYRQVNAMYYENRSIKSIVAEILSRNEDLCEFQIIEMIQAIDAKQKMREEKETDDTFRKKYGNRNNKPKFKRAY